MNRREFDASFKRMAIDLSYARGSVKEVAKSFFKTMKSEMVYHHNFATRQEARLAVFEYIESFYNRKRRYSVLGYLTPCQYESLLYNQALAA